MTRHCDAAANNNEDLPGITGDNCSITREQ